MSIYVSTWCWQHSRASGADLLVLLAIADQANDDGQEAWPSHATLADRCRVSVKTTQRATQRLMELGELTIDRHAGPASQGATRQHPNKYSFPAYQAYRKQGQSDAASARAAAKAATSAHRSSDILARSSDTAMSPYPSLDPPLNLDPKSKSTSPDVADAPPHDDREQPSLPDTPPVKAAVQDLGTGPEREADPTVLDKPSADDLAAGPANSPARLDVKALCDRLADGMVANDCLRPTITQGWRDAARLLIDKDGRELGKALALIDWCQADEFWRGNIKSMSRFRAQYDTLRLRALGEWERGKGRGGGHVPFRCPTDPDAYDEPLRVRA